MALGRAPRKAMLARARREFLYALVSLPLAGLGLGAVFVTSMLALLSAIVVIGPLLPLALAVDRGLGRLFRAVGRRLLGIQVAAPIRPRRQRGVAGFIAYHWADPVAWRAVGYFALRVPLGFLQFMLGVVPWGYGVFFLAYPVLRIFEPAHTTAAHGARHSGGLQIGQFYLDTWPRALGLSCAGLVLLLAAPWITHAVLLPDRWLLPKLLGPSGSSRRIQELEETRSHVINEAALTLRRVERDLHDGAQARLVALGMRLGRAETRLDRGETAQAQALIRDSREEIKGIIVDLRELVRGIHPPALDAGLEAALGTLVARAAIPTIVRVSLPARPSTPVETMLYFAAAELVTNAGKHSRATAASIGVVTDGATVRLTVTDDGLGGATLNGAGTGLRGLAERVRTVDGSFDVSSPPGGPTTVTIDVPNSEPGGQEDRCGS
ncbi:MAG: sensor histidine kinase [Frankia sp.]